MLSFFRADILFQTIWVLPKLKASEIPIAHEDTLKTPRIPSTISGASLKTILSHYHYYSVQFIDSKNRSAGTFVSFRLGLKRFAESARVLLVPSAWSGFFALLE